MSVIRKKLRDYHAGKNQFLNMLQPTWVADYEGNVFALMRSQSMSTDALEDFQKEILAHEQGLTIDDEWVLPFERDPSYERLMRTMDLPKTSEIIFTTEELERFEALADDTDDAPEPDRPKQRSQAQDETILRLLNEKGYDLVALPQNAIGTPGVKAEIRAATGTKGMRTGSTIFDKAWERLSKNGDISYKQ